jgi:hypothetical protein
MPLIRVPYPKDPERRQALYARVTELISRFGAHEGTAEAGMFNGSTPAGPIAGTYRLVESSQELEIEVTKKPWLISTSFLEAQVRDFLAAEHVRHESNPENVDPTS